MDNELIFRLDGQDFRVTPDGKRMAVFDLIKAACEVENPRDIWAALTKSYPEVVDSAYNFQFPGQGQRPTPTVDKAGWVRLSMLLPGRQAAKWRAKYADVITRYLDGDRSLADEIHARAERLGPSSARAVFDEVAPEVMRALARKAASGSVQAARLLLQYRAQVEPPAPPTPKDVPRPALAFTSNKPLSQHERQAQEWAPKVSAWLEAIPARQVTISEVLNALGVPKEKWRNTERLAVVKILRGWGWRQGRNNRTRYYYLPN